MPETMPGSIDVIIDINHDNHFDAIKARNAGVRAVIHKASEGATFQDPAYGKATARRAAAGLLWGAYHSSSSRPANEQADNFLAATQCDDPAVDNTATLFCLDFEPSPSGPDMTLEQAQAFVVGVKDKTGRWPMIYGGNMLRDAAGTWCGPHSQELPALVCPVSKSACWHPDGHLAALYPLAVHRRQVGAGTPCLCGNGSRRSGLLFRN
ncbi:glycoside hydrolase family 25 protein [Cupriavidus basilensis]